MSAPRPIRRQRIHGIMAIAICLATAAIYPWMASRPGLSLDTAAPSGYYAQLTDAFFSGQMHLKVQPDPRLKHLPNPWRIVPGQDIPRLPESSYFNDQYYLYFSATPAVLLSGPWRILTGRFLTDEGCTFILALAGLVLMALIVWGAWRRWFRRLSPVWPACTLAVVALSTRIPQLLPTPTVHHVPLVAAHVFALAAVAVVFW
jgi:hypothetical protein